jgi:tRNA G18 (ribose-2'-O)-methylase SpoU
MIEIIQTERIDGPELVPFRTLRQPAEHFNQGIFIAEGEKVARRLFESRLQVLSVLITPEWFHVYRSMLESRPESIKVYIAPKDLLESIVGFNLHQGIMGLGRIPGLSTVESVLAAAREPRLFAAIDGLTNSENIGVLVRNCAAFGVQAILVGETSSSPYLRRAVRNSMGTVFTMPIIHCSSLIGSLDHLRKNHQFSIFAAHPHTDEHRIDQVDFKRDCCIVFGCEGNGLSSAVLKACDQQVVIPMQLGVDSLNVASASAVFLYEVFRQRSIS